MTAPLFERQSTGGVVARVGFDYQDSFLLQSIPLLLSQGAFSHAVSELVGDVEVRYHRPQGGTLCVLYEAKRGQLTKNEIWKEVVRFLELHRAAPDEYVRFVLVCGSYNKDFDPLIRKLERYRGPGESLNQDSAFRVSAEADITGNIVDFGQTAELADFVLRRVTFLEYDDTNVDGAFMHGLTTLLPQMADMRVADIAEYRRRCKSLVEDSTRRHVTRHALESALVECAPNLAADWLAMPTSLLLTATPADAVEELSVDVGNFNGEGRGNLGAAKWQELQSQLASLGQFVLSSRERRGIHLSAKQRMSLACTVGFSLSATSGLSLQIEHNGKIIDTAVHDRSNLEFFKADESAGVVQSAGGAGVAYIGFPYPGKDDVLRAADVMGLADVPRLFLSSSTAVTDVSVMNTAVSESKAALAGFRSRHNLSQLHLFIKAPSSFAMSLGHRLNAVGFIQLYDWVETAYLPTAQLR